MNVFYFYFLPGYYYEVALKTTGAAMVSFQRTVGQINLRHVI